MNKQYALTIDFNKEDGTQRDKTTAINKAVKAVSTMTSKSDSPGDQKIHRHATKAQRQKKRGNK